jgi:hypothetical protein
MNTLRPASTLGTLRRVNGSRPQVAADERCDMCAAPVAREHQHVVDLHSRSLLCACRPCYLLFTDQQADIRYRAVPDRYLAFPGFRLGQGDWEDLQIPVGLAFLFRNSVQGKVVAFYPSPAGATESELDLRAWSSVCAANPELQLEPDSEALVVNRLADPPQHMIVPIDAAYGLVGVVKSSWEGITGGAGVADAVAQYLEDLRGRPAVGA